MAYPLSRWMRSWYSSRSRSPCSTRLVAVCSVHSVSVGVTTGERAWTTNTIRNTASATRPTRARARALGSPLADATSVHAWAAREAEEAHAGRQGGVAKPAPFGGHERGE